MVNYKKQGKKNRASGADFENRTRKDLEESGWIVSKWQNNVDLKEGMCIKAKAKWAGPGRPMMVGQGFPDFIAYKNYTDQADCGGPCFDVVFVESKSNGTLDADEREKARWYLKNGYCSQFLISYKTKEKNRIKVNYKEFKYED